MKTKRLFLILMIVSIVPAILSTFIPARAASIVVTTHIDAVDPMDGLCTLREATIAANTNTKSGDVAGECPAGSDTETDVIVLGDGVEYTLLLMGKDEDASDSGDLDLLDNTAELDVQFVVENNGQATIIGDGDDRVIHVIGATVEFNQIHITKGNAMSGALDYGGNLLNQEGNVTIYGGVISQGEAGSGGGILSFSNSPGKGKFEIHDAQIIQNVADVGGGVGAGGDYSEIIMNGVVVRGNTSTISGGGISVIGGTMQVISSTISMNTAEEDGGGMRIWVIDQLTVTHTLVETNKATNGDGGGIHLGSSNDLGNIYIADSTFSKNTAGEFGGGLYESSTQFFSLHNTTFISNDSGIRGGAVHASYPLLFGGEYRFNHSAFGGAIYAEFALEVSDAHFSGNIADVMGGAIHARFADVLHSQFTENTAFQFGGAIRTLADITMEDTSLANNHADLGGGGIYLEGPALSTGSYVLNSTLSENTTNQNGAGIFLGPNFSLGMFNSTLAKNEAVGVGGGIFVAATGILTTTNVTFAGNEATGMQGTAIHNAGQMVMRNTLFGPHLFDTCFSVNPANLVSLGHNLSETSHCNLNASGDLPNTPAGLEDDLQDNGGYTWTWALLPSSAAVNAGDASVCGLQILHGKDQRGVPHMGVCDIGAYEFMLQLFLPVMIK